MAAHQETADNYGRVVAQISPAERIIRCRDDLQFIAQTRKKGGAERPWRSFWYFATRQGAARLGASFSGPALALLRTIVRGCLREQGLPAGRKHVNAAIELIEAGFARVCQHGDSYWLETL